jgi:uncharacterized protein (TIGR02145 family)
MKQVTKTIKIFTTIAILIIAMTSLAQNKSTFTDLRDGKLYKTVKIGTQVWMAENLAYGASDGCFAYNNDQSKVAIYGYLYTFSTAKNVCPTGWHLPTFEEWDTLITYLGGDSVAGGKLKESGTTHWTSPNSGATNKSGFIALPGGKCTDGSRFNFIGTTGFWWSSSGHPLYGETEETASRAWFRIMYYEKGEAPVNESEKSRAFSVRCVKD